MSIDGGLRPIFRKKLLPGHLQTIETGMVGGGVPDLNGCIDGVEFWLELKKTHAWAVKIQVAQPGWAEARTRAGGRVFMAVRRYRAASARNPACDDLWLLTHDAARLLISGTGLNKLPAAVILGVWAGGPANWPWATIRQVLTK
jgi:hypothetical protein